MVLFSLWKQFFNVFCGSGEGLSAQPTLGDYKFITESLHAKLEVWSLKDVCVYIAASDATGCILGNVGYSDSGAWPVLDIKVRISQTLWQQFCPITL